MVMTMFLSFVFMVVLLLVASGISLLPGYASRKASAAPNWQNAFENLELLENKAAYGNCGRGHSGAATEWRTKK
jgi:hypothetical protein